MEANAVLKRVGWSLVAVGLIDICVMAVVLARGRSYGSSFNLFALVAGVLLVRGHLATARWVAIYSSFYAVGFAGAALLLLIFYPAELLALQFRREPLVSLGFTVGLPLLVAWLVWVGARLASPAVRAAQRSAGVKESGRVGGAIAGLGLLASLVGFMTIHAPERARAIELARAQVGADFSFFVERLHVSPTRNKARVAAWRGDELHEVEVEW